MKKFGKLLVPVIIATLALGACGKDEETAKGKTLKVGASNVPHAEILEAAKPILEKEGIDLEVEVIEGYVLPNTALDNGDIDANFFQHEPYLKNFNKEHGLDLVNAGGIHLEPIGFYSKKYKNISDLPKNATIILSNSISDHGRILTLLEKEGLITIKDGVDKTTAQIEDIDKNDKNIKFKYDFEPALLPQIFNGGEGDAVAINTNFAMDAGLDPLKDPIALEGDDSDFVNIVAVQKGDEDREDIKKLIKALQSQEIQDFITDEYKGAILATPTTVK